MMEVLKFIFRDFWTFCGTIILLYVIGMYCITAPITAIATAIVGSKVEKKKKEKNKDEEDDF